MSEKKEENKKAIDQFNKGEVIEIRVTENVWVKYNKWHFDNQDMRYSKSDSGYYIGEDYFYYEIRENRKL